MSCDVIWCVFIWCDAISCVVWCHVMHYDVLCCAMWLVAMSRCVVRSGCVGWIGRWSGDPYYTDLLRTTQYYKVLLQYYSVLHRHSTTPVLLCTTKYYSVLQSTTPVYTTLYYKVLLQYYSVLQSTTRVLLCTTPCTTKYSFARRGAPTSPNALPATQSDSHDWCPSHMKRHLQCAEQQDSSSNLIKSCTCHVKWLSWLMSVTYETSFTMRGATGLIFERHQILRLPRKMTLMIDVRHIWNVIYNARSNRHHPPTSPNTAPAT